MIFRTVCRLSLVVLMLVASIVVADDEFNAQKDNNWHQFRGPEGNGFTPSGNPPVKWDENTNVKWKLPIPGDSTATPIIWGENIFAVSAVETDREGKADFEGRPFSEGEQSRIRSMGIKPPTHFYQFFVYGIDRQTGNIKWQRMVKEEVPHEGTHADGSYAAMTPTTDGKHLYVSFGSRGVYCFDFAGNQVWKRDLGKMNVFSTFGESISPVIHGETLVINWDHETGSFMVALDAKTGETKWRIERDEKTNWSSPIVADYEGRSQVITYNKNRIRSNDLQTGDLIWECHGSFTACVPMPVAYKDMVFCMTGYQGYELLAVKLDSKGDVTDTDKIVWQAKQGTPYCPSALLYGDMLYFTQGNNGILTCLKADNGEKIIEKKRLQGLSNIYASPVGAAGRVYITGRDGVTLVLKKDTEVDVLSTNKLDEPIDASAAVVGNQIYLRSRKSLYCIAAE